MHGCSGGLEDGTGTDYCFDPTGYLWYAGNDLDEGEDRLTECQGDCDDDSECDVGLKCFQRVGLEDVPGCHGSGLSGKDYCYDESLSVSDIYYVMLYGNSTMMCFNVIMRCGLNIYISYSFSSLFLFHYPRLQHPTRYLDMDHHTLDHVIVPCGIHYTINSNKMNSTPTPCKHRKYVLHIVRHTLVLAM